MLRPLWFLFGSFLHAEELNLQYCDLRAKNAKEDGTRRRHTKVDLSTYEKEEDFAEIFKDGHFFELPTFVKANCPVELHTATQAEMIHYVEEVTLNSFF